MKSFITLLTASTLLAFAAPAQASDLSRAIDSFCVSVRRNINKQGMSAAPGSAGGSLIAATAKQTPAKYAALWAIAKGTSNSNCKRMY